MLLPIPKLHDNGTRKYLGHDYGKYMEEKDPDLRKNDSPDLLRLYGSPKYKDLLSLKYIVRTCRTSMRLALVLIFGESKQKKPWDADWETLDTWLRRSSEN